MSRWGRRIGGALDGDRRLVFPNARYVMGKTEWEFWAARPDLMNLHIPDHLRQLILTCARETLPRLRERMDLVEAGEEIAPGLRVIAAPGHTPGQMALSVTSGAETFLALTDVFLHPIHVEHPEWYAPFDYDPEATVATRRRLYERKAESKALVTAGHLAWPCLGRIQRDGDGWRWRPLGV